MVADAILNFDFFLSQAQWRLAIRTVLVFVVYV